MGKGDSSTSGWTKVIERVIRRNRRQLRLSQKKMEGQEPYYEQEPLENTQQEEERCEEGQQHLPEDQPED